LRTGSYFAIDRKMGEKLIDFGAPQWEGVDPFAVLVTVEDEETGDPADVGFLGSFSDVEDSREASSFVN
jgi:hypothetical protein